MGNKNNNLNNFKRFVLCNTLVTKNTTFRDIYISF